MIVLVGFMGTGKSTVGRILASLTGRTFIDTDAEVQRLEGLKIADIFASRGEAHFREIERRVAADALQQEHAVVALGGGAHLDPVTAAALEWAMVVHLETSFREVMRRIGSDPDRPLLHLRDPLALFDERSLTYQSIADIAVSTDGRRPHEVAREIASRIGVASAAEEPRGGTRRVAVKHERGSYEVVIGMDLLSHAGTIMPLPAAAENVFVLTHAEVASYARVVVDALRPAAAVHVLEVSAGEASKSLRIAGDVLEGLSARGAHRHDLVVSVGGGVVSDLAGFVASVFARGIAVAHVPTTLLAQVDAAIGGKTAVNLPRGKNLVGTIHQPSGVICDVTTLRTLPERDYRSGLAEVVKYALIRDRSFVTFLHERREPILAREPEVLIDLVERCVRIKAAVVAADERERGERAILNYGHTVGHALEVGLGYETIRHGEAVSLGMMAAAHTAHALGRLSAADVALHRALLEGFGLPVTVSVDRDELESAWLKDKKYERGMRLVLLRSIGDAEFGIAVEPDLLRGAVEALRT